MIRRLLEPGEQLLWSGRPGQGVRLRRADRWAIPFTFGWLGIVVSAAVTEPSLHHSYFLQIVMSVLLVAGFFMAILRIPLDAWVRANTAYGVTDRRALIIGGILFRSKKSVPFTEIPAITLSERRDGEGDVVLDARDMSHVAVGGLVPKRETVPDAFQFLPNARHVYEIVREAHRTAIRRRESHRTNVGLYTLLRRH